ncbi:MAG: toxic anion resistance protein [Firmicutes bacterium]|nr:toxic anion resistance protein [Bacillota bacterium]MBQ9604972.1 toxic anion resistance protein [Bacillota bacterium]
MGDFNLELPTQEEVKQEVEQLIMPTEKEQVVIKDTAQTKAEQIMKIDIDSFEQRKEYTDVIEQFGLADMKRSAGSNAILQKRINSFQITGSENGEVAQGLAELTLKMKDLDPSHIDFAKTGVLGKLFNPVRMYFEKFKTADAEIATIVDSLNKGKKNLENDNVTLELEEKSLREITKKMQQNIELGSKLDNCLASGIEQARFEGKDEEKIRFIEEEILYPLRQRIEDFQQIQVVSQQGIIAMEVLRRNNKELIRSVDRANNVTVTALRTAVTVAGALYNQKIVLEKVDALNKTTNQMIESTAKMLRQQGVAIHEQASESSLNTDVLKAAFEETFNALDDISDYKREALPRMAQTIEDFKQIAATGEQRISEMERGGLL